MSKKALKGLIKTRHFIERQKERQVTDKDVLRALSQGELVENDHGQNFVLGKLKVTVDYSQEVLITVHPGDPSTKSVKILSKEEALKIKEYIEKNRRPETVEEPDEFLSYVQETGVKKLKK